MDDNLSEKQWTLISHLSGFLGYIIPFGNIVGPLVVWLFKRDQSVVVEEHAREALNFQISITIYFIIAGILALLLIGFLFLLILAVLQIILVIKATMEADKGRLYRYPMTFRFF